MGRGVFSQTQKLSVNRYWKLAFYIIYVPERDNPNWFFNRPDVEWRARDDAFVNRKRYK